ASRTGLGQIGRVRAAPSAAAEQPHSHGRVCRRATNQSGTDDHQARSSCGCAHEFPPVNLLERLRLRRLRLLMRIRRHGITLLLAVGEGFYGPPDLTLSEAP